MRSSKKLAWTSPTARREGFERRLSAMQRDGPAHAQTRRDANFCVVTKLDLITGKVQGHPDGFGFLIRGRTAAPNMFLGAAPKMQQDSARRPAWQRERSGLDRRGRPRSEISSKCWSTSITGSSGGLRNEQGRVLRGARKTGASARN